MSGDEPAGESPGDTGRQVVEYRRYLPTSLEWKEVDFRPDSWSNRLRRHFDRHRHFYGRYQPWLGKARMGTTFDVYLSRVFKLACSGFLIGTVFGLLTVIGIENLTSVSISMLPMGILFSLIAGFLLGGIVGTGLLLYPWYIARQRREKIEVVLPHMVVFMRAASQIDPNPNDLIKEVANYTTIYGELAHEFETIRKDIELLNDDLLRSLDNADSFIPSAELREFLNDLSSLLESGGSVEKFLDHEVQQQLNKTENELEDLLRTLTTLAPIYVIMVAVGPVVILVALLVLGMIGANVTHFLFILTYIGLPIIILVSVLTLDALASRQRLDLQEQLEPMFDEPSVEKPDPPTSWFEKYEKRSRYESYLRRFREPLETMQDRPYYSLLLTGPLAVLVYIVIIAGDILPLTIDAITAHPVPFTTGYLVIPFLIVSLPVMGLHELKMRRARAFEYRFPDVLYSLASGNERGVPLEEGIEMIARQFEGPVADEFQKAHRDIQLEHDVASALTNLANRRQLPRITMTLAVLRKIIRSSEDIASSLQSLADDLEMRLSLEQQRRQELRMYAVVVSLGVLVYLLIVIVLDAYLLPQIPDLESQSIVGSGEQPAIEVYETIFFHSALILSIGSGLLMGKLTHDSLLSGLKYVHGLIITVLIAFLLAGFF